MRMPPKSLWPQFFNLPGRDPEPIYVETKMQPMPTVARARIYLPDVQAALDRARDAWNPTQMHDALRSLRTFIDRAEEMLLTDQDVDPKGGA